MHSSNSILFGMVQPKKKDITMRVISSNEVMAVSGGGGWEDMMKLIHETLDGWFGPPIQSVEIRGVRMTDTQKNAYDMAGVMETYQQALPGCVITIAYQPPGDTVASGAGANGPIPTANVTVTSTMGTWLPTAKCGPKDKEDIP
ncbi:hypothetical protein [Massilia sp. CCM 8734]|uniref:hypothetical protein n=1 Tax=Massilia sp. CCM 8734 TaxID=2609283 RepID=UPI0014229287|nr:hypothetical protein [Massilia sp. CCM 8734]NIA00766.1 hypothetical protein [Massilia sp. CCM 8734]